VRLEIGVDDVRPAVAVHVPDHHHPRGILGVAGLGGRESAAADGAQDRHRLAPFTDDREIRKLVPGDIHDLHGRGALGHVVEDERVEQATPPPERRAD